MKKFISFIIIAILLIQMYLPVLSFATNDKVALDNHIIKALNEGNYDKDEDGEFTIEELSKVYWLYIDCDDEFVDLTGIENMTNLSTIGFNSATSDMDFTVLSQLPLDTLFLSGFTMKMYH